MFIHMMGSQTLDQNILSDLLKTVLKFIKKRKKNKWADLGCGNGEFLSQVKKEALMLMVLI